MVLVASELLTAGFMEALLLLLSVDDCRLELLATSMVDTEVDVVLGTLLLSSEDIEEGLVAEAEVVLKEETESLISLLLLEDSDPGLDSDVLVVVLDTAAEDVALVDERSEEDVELGKPLGVELEELALVCEDDDGVTAELAVDD